MKSTSALTVLCASVVSAQVAQYGQCGGINYTGSTTCVAGSVCTVLNSYYSQCVPGSGSPPSTSTTSHITSSTKPGSTMTTSTKTTTSSPSPTSSSTGKVRFAGVNIAGFDFGCTTDGTCTQGSTNGPYGPTGGTNPDGPGQMTHFVNDDNMNIFRLPVGWQYLVGSVLGGQLNSANFAQYNILVNACLATGAYCIIDIHNYARWNGGIIGQGGPTNAQFTNLWTQLATYYAGQSRIIFGIMNEPHDLTISTWAGTVQAAVTAIRSAGATSQLILLPGTQYTSAGAFISTGSAAALLPVKNPDGSTTGLIFDVHKYLDSDNSGGGADCVTNNIADAFQPLAAWLNSVGRQAILSETGGPNTANCATYLCQEIAYLNANSNVYLGYVGWSAGSFDSTYALVETPTKNGGSWQDKSLVSQCLKR